MKTILENNYSFAQQLIIAIVSAFFGYERYQEIVSTERSQLTLIIMLVVITYALINKYGTRPAKKNI